MASSAGKAKIPVYRYHIPAIVYAPKLVAPQRVALGFVGDDAKTDADITQHTGMLRIGNDRLDRWTMTPALGSHRQIKRTILELT